MKMKSIYGMICILILSSPLISSSSYLEQANHVVGIGGGIVGTMHAVLVCEDANARGIPISYTLLEAWQKDVYLRETTGAVIMASKTKDEGACVVPPASKLKAAMKQRFDEGGIRVDDVPGVNDSQNALRFMRCVEILDKDKAGEAERTEALLMFGSFGMKLWANFYDRASPKLRRILDDANNKPCGSYTGEQKLGNGYRIDPITNVTNALNIAKAKMADYEKLGDDQCEILSPDKTMGLDPALTEFVMMHSEVNDTAERVWHSDSVALWRPGGCVDGRVLLPTLHKYLEEETEGRFQIQFGRKVTGVRYDAASADTRILGLEFAGGDYQEYPDARFVFCPGEAVGTLASLGFQAPVDGGFGGASLKLMIPISEDMVFPRDVDHCMEAHIGPGLGGPEVDVVLPFQTRVIEQDGKEFLSVGVAGTKAWYDLVKPQLTDEFVQVRTFHQAQIIEKILPWAMRMARKATGLSEEGALTKAGLDALEAAGIAKKRAGVRSVVPDCLPTLADLYQAISGNKVLNAIVATHFGSGGVSYALIGVVASLFAIDETVIDVFAPEERDGAREFLRRMLILCDSRRDWK